MSDNNDFGSFVLGFLVGGLVGAATALLMAPQSGEETRTVIKEKAIELSDKATEKVDDAYARLEDTLAKAQVQIEELTQATKEKAEELQAKGQVLIEEQVSKLKKTSSEILPDDTAA